MEIRREITDTVVKEIVGPRPNPEYLDPDMEEEFEVYKQAIKINLGDAKAHYGRGTRAFTYIFNLRNNV